jgi:cation diffusion facilitator family transporter
MSIEKTATIIATITATLLSILKLTVGIISGSTSILASAIDSLLDTIISLFNIYAIHTSQLPADSKFNYGRGKIEALAATVEGLLIGVSGVFIIFHGIQKIFIDDSIKIINYSIYLMLFSIVVTFILVLFLNHVANKTNNLIIKSDLLHYKTDLWSNLAVILSLVLVYFFDMPIIDSIIGITIGIYIIYPSYTIFKSGLLILLDASSNSEFEESITSIIKNQKKITNFHFLKTRTSGNTIFVDVHLVFDCFITVFDAHKICDMVELQIKEIDNSKQWVINTHMDPYDDSV